MTQMPRALRTSLDVAYFAIAAYFTLHLFVYYVSGEGGPTVLAVTLVPVCFILFVLSALRAGDFYPRVGLAANLAIAAAYIALALAVLYYIRTEFYAIRTDRAGFWNTTDLIMGAVMTLLIMEHTRKRYFALFVLNCVLVLYAVYGYVVPGMFGHPGLDWERIVTAMSLETSTGVYSRLPQLALTLIGSFLLVLSVLRAFGCIDSILLGANLIAARSPHALPQAAVLGSFGVAAVSGSSAANAATTGSATIPAMIQAGLPREVAASIETASSLGGQLMPPVMGISAFLMADFMGRSYFDVVARGYAPALIYFASVVVAVYLLSVTHRPSRQVELPGGNFGWGDAVNICAFLAVVAALIGLMGIVHIAPMIAAHDTFVVVAPLMLAFFLYRRWRVGDSMNLRNVATPIGRLVDIFAGMTADLTLLLATLSIMTGAFVITGIPTKVGALLVQSAGVSLLAMAIVAFLFGVLIGTGLPPAPTYILTILVIGPPMIKAGVDPWVVHFYAFFLAVWGELTPPTSVVAAVTAKIADANFMGTLMRGIVLCVSLFMLMAGVFVRPDLVVDPGLPQLAAVYLVLTATIGVTFSIQARFADARYADILARLVLAALSFFVLFYPDEGIAAAGSIPVLLMIAGWFALGRQRRAAPAGTAA